MRIKRLGDLTIAFTLLTFLLPLMAIVALMIKFEGWGPVFETQQRLGFNGRWFRLLRFRSSRAGRLLAYTRIGELPQLINVVRGDMTFFRNGLPQFRLLD